MNVIMALKMQCVSCKQQAGEINQDGRCRQCCGHCIKCGSYINDIPETKSGLCLNCANQVLERLDEMEYALVGGNIVGDDIPFQEMRQWITYVKSGINKRVCL